MWALNPESLQIRRKENMWIADWPETEAYEIGPSSISWIMWHVMYWWKSALDYNFEEGKLQREEVVWPGSVEAARDIIVKLHEQWIQKVEAMSDEELASNEHAHWPFEGESFMDIALWLNVELTKNAAEIGNGRFLYAVSAH